MTASDERGDDRIVINVTTADGELLDTVETTRSELARDQRQHPTGLLGQVQA